jgi:hypothetical protein
MDGLTAERLLRALGGGRGMKGKQEQPSINLDEYPDWLVKWKRCDCTEWKTDKDEDWRCPSPGSQRARIVGLKNSAKYNGKICMVIRYQDEKKRYVVRTIEEKKTLSVQAENLRNLSSKDDESFEPKRVGYARTTDCSFGYGKDAVKFEWTETRRCECHDRGAFCTAHCACILKNKCDNVPEFCSCVGKCKPYHCPCVAAGRPCTEKCTSFVDSGSDSRGNIWNTLEREYGMKFEDLHNCIRQPLALDPNVDVDRLFDLLSGSYNDFALTTDCCDTDMAEDGAFELCQKFGACCECSYSDDPYHCSLCKVKPWAAEDKEMYNDAMMDDSFVHHCPICGKCGDKREQHCENCDRCFNGNQVLDVPCTFCGKRDQECHYLVYEKKLDKLKKAVKRNPGKTFLLQERVIQSKDSKRRKQQVKIPATSPEFQKAIEAAARKLQKLKKEILEDLENADVFPYIGW